MTTDKDNPQPIIEVDKLTVEYDGREVLKEVSFKMFPEEITVILGKSGCGKTTVLKHIVGLQPVNKGQIRIMGQDIRKVNEEEMEELALKMGVLFQNGALLNSLTVRENVAIPLEQHTGFPEDLVDVIVRKKLQLVGLIQALFQYPSQLSGGMRKRASLARALALDPPLLFADEPSAGLDPVTLNALDHLLLEFKSKLGITILLVTHEIPSVIRLADRMVFLEEGKVLFEGSLEDGQNAGIEQIDDFFKEGMPS
ncbi:MAG: ATP-binding cassette domain-containing protein [Calditrichia bacterium]